MHVLVIDLSTKARMGVGKVVEGMRPAASMVAVQTAFAGVNIFYKLALNDGMSMRVLIAYRNLFAAACLSPLAYLVERKTRPRLTWRILTQGFLCGLFGLTMSQNFYIVTLKLTTPTFASAMSNLIPAITFTFAVLFGLENLVIQTVSGWAKLIGTLVGIGGAMLLTFYKGAEVKLWSTNLNLLKNQHAGVYHASAPPHHESSNHVMGLLSALGSCLTYSIWLIIQANMSKAFPYHYSCTALMSLMAAIQCTIFALCMERDWSQWKMGFDIRLLTTAFTGIVVSGLILVVLSWCIKKKGPLYVSVFNPLMLVMVAFLSSLLLDEKLRVGSIVGAVLIVIGLYLVLWGKSRQATKFSELTLPSRAEGPPEESFRLEVVSSFDSKEEREEPQLGKPSDEKD